MKMLYQTVCVAFSMYSALPMPRVEWTKKNMRYAMCLFPLVGAVIGGLLLLWAAVCRLLGLPSLLFAGGAALLPLGVTGGIHLDGLCDTADALGSHAPREKKLEILKDPHIGAFGVMACAAYFVGSLALWGSLRGGADIAVLSAGYVLSRILSGLAVVWFPCAKDSGLAAAFSVAAEKRRARFILLGMLALCAGGMLALSPLYGALAVLAAAWRFFSYRRLARRAFGGITGDLAGYFLQLCEVWMLAACVAGEAIQHAFLLR